jgi:hypothetical protein
MLTSPVNTFVGSEGYYYYHACKQNGCMCLYEIIWKHA